MRQIGKRVKPQPDTQILKHHPEGLPESWTKTRPADRSFPEDPIPEPEPVEPGLCPIMGERCQYAKGAIHTHSTYEREGGVPGSVTNERERI